MQLYDYYRSTACYRVRIALNVKQIAYDKIPIHLVNNGGEQHQADYLKVNPQALVPTLNVDGHFINQSLAIIEYLEETYPTPALLPQEALARARVRSLAFMIACDMHPLNNLRTTQQLRSQFSANDKEVQTWYFHWLKLGFDALEAHLNNISRQKSVCYGNDITLADLCLVPQVFNANRFGFALDNYPLIKAINDYCLSLDAFNQAKPTEAS